MLRDSAPTGRSSPFQFSIIITGYAVRISLPSLLAFFPRNGSRIFVSHLDHYPDRLRLGRDKCPRNSLFTRGLLPEKSGRDFF